MKKNLVVFGRGNHSKVALDLINEKKDLKLILHIDGKNLKEFKKIYIKNKKKLFCHIAIGSNYVRKKIYNKLDDNFPKLK